jgi:hypothetical protein
VNTSLVPVMPVNRDTDKPRPASRPDCGFVAHLIATKAQAPQTRSRRRAEPGEAISAYVALDWQPNAAGRVLARSL